MRFWLECLIVSIPLTALAFPLGGRAVEPGWLLSALVAFLYLADRLGHPERPVARGCRFGFAILIFVALGLFALEGSPYATGRSVLKGATQALGILCALGTTLALIESIRGDPGRFERYVRLLVRVIYVVAGIGVIQFVLANMLGAPSLADFSFFRELTGNPGAWRFPGTIGGVQRANSIAAEPAHLSLFLGTVGGLALLRVGASSDHLSLGVSHVISRKQAWVVLLCWLFTVSIVGYAVLGATLALLFWATRRITMKPVLTTAVATAAAFAGVILWAAQSQEGLGGKLSTLPLVFTRARDLDSTVDTQALSAVAILSNRMVAARNLEDRPLVGIGFGAHPESFLKHAPTFEGLENRLNAQDASGLLLRLLSETGLFGTLLFLGTWLVVFTRAREAILRRIEAGPVTLKQVRLVSLSAGLTAGGSAVFLAYLGRMGVYYAPTLWVMLGLVAAVPTVLRRGS